MPFWIFTLLAGLISLFLAVDRQWAWCLPDTVKGQTIIVTGTIVSIPKNKDRLLQFEMLVDGGEIFPILRLNWRANPQQLTVGDRWQLSVRLKSPRGFWDPGSFDYQAWLFENRIRATGYVVPSHEDRLLSRSHLQHSIDQLREKLADAISVSLDDKPLAGLIAALAVGMRDHITAQQWAVMRGTGTNHLFAIAGLHIGFIAGMFYTMVNFIWRRAGRLPLYLATPQAAALAALFAAILYSALAGFALPTQRAVLMTAVFLAATLWRKKLSAWYAWRLALLIILIWEPLVILSASFWLSFGAVAIIIYGVSARLKQGNLLWQWGRAQWVVAIGLIPFSLLFFQQASLAGFIANAIAIPCVGFVILPLSVLGNIAWLIAPKLATGLWILAEYALELVWFLLSHIAALNWAQWITPISNPWVLLSGLVAILLLLAPRGIPCRWLGFIWLMPLLIWQPSKPSNGEVWFTLLDAGRGLSAVIQTRHHTLVYDTGQRFSANFNAATAVLLPYLQILHINRIDDLIVSRGDSSHLGGAASLLAQIPLQHIITSAPRFFAANLATPCSALPHWQWDNVKFQILNKSCDLYVTTGIQHILLTAATQNIQVGGAIYAPATDGAILFKLTGKNILLKPEIYQKHFWDY